MSYSRLQNTLFCLQNQEMPPHILPWTIPRLSKGSPPCYLIVDTLLFPSTDRKAQHWLLHTLAQDAARNAIDPDFLHTLQDACTTQRTFPESLTRLTTLCLENDRPDVIAHVAHRIRTTFGYEPLHEVLRDQPNIAMMASELFSPTPALNIPLNPNHTDTCAHRMIHLVASLRAQLHDLGHDVVTFRTPFDASSNKIHVALATEHRARAHIDIPSRDPSCRPWSQVCEDERKKFGRRHIFRKIDTLDVRLGSLILPEPNLAILTAFTLNPTYRK